MIRDLLFVTWQLSYFVMWYAGLSDYSRISRMQYANICVTGRGNIKPGDGELTRRNVTNVTARERERERERGDGVR